ncbi:dna-binding horma domain-containing protein [Moniliophthora roreri]|nr:dna-binding horma domain-containing protein [Moniliophthora roreri]
MQHSDEPIAQTIEQRSSVGSFGQEHEVRPGVGSGACSVQHPSFNAIEKNFQAHRMLQHGPIGGRGRRTCNRYFQHEIANNLDWSIHMKTGIIVYTYQGSEC